MPCGKCNVMKMGLSVRDFVNHIKRLYDNISERVTENDLDLLESVYV
jgi:hypothetical protein